MTGPASRRQLVHAALSAVLGAGAGGATARFAGPPPLQVPDGSPPAGLDVRDFGARGDGTTDDSPAFSAALRVARDSLRTLPHDLQSDPSGSVVVHIPPGDYLITSPGGLLGVEDPDRKGLGLHFSGAGDGISNIIFKPSEAAALCRNDFWLDLRFDDLGFYAATPGCTFFDSVTTHNAQRYRFDGCGWRRWKYAFHLEGDDNNSEYAFTNCHSSGMEDAGAFLHIPEDGASDQFLNYWFYACTHWSTSAPFVDIARGGHVHIFGLDVSDWAGDLSSPGHLFALRGTNHALGVCVFEADGVRVEAKSPLAGLLLAEWPQGHVTFRNTDWSSQAGSFTYGDIITIRYVNSDGAGYAFYDSTLAGGVAVESAVNDWQHAHSIAFVRCTWLQRHSPSDVVSYRGGGRGDQRSEPPVEFSGCRGGDNDVLAAVGAATWDARTGYRGQPVQALTRRTLSVRGVRGLPTSSERLTVTLPVGALVTGLQAVTAADDPGSGRWVLSTTEAPPRQVAVAGAAPGAPGDALPGATGPFLCTTAEQATLTVVGSGGTGPAPEGLLLITGYW